MGSGESRELSGRAELRAMNEEGGRRDGASALLRREKVGRKQKAYLMEGMAHLVKEGDNITMLHQSRLRRRRLGEIGDHCNGWVVSSSILILPSWNQSPNSGMAI